MGASQSSSVIREKSMDEREMLQLVTCCHSLIDSFICDARANLATTINSMESPY